MIRPRQNLRLTSSAMCAHKNKGTVPDDAGRGDTLSSLLKQIEDLGSRLSKAFNVDPVTPRTTENSRVELSIALTSVALFVGEVFGREYAPFFFELSLALNDLNHGTIQTLLKASTKNSRPPDPSSLWYQRAIVALRVSDLKMGNPKLSWQEAARQTAKEYPELKRLAGAKAKGPLAVTIYNWHKEFKANRVKNEEARMAYEAGLQILAERHEK